MKLFHISDVLSVSTGRLVSSRHMEGVYDILNFLTGDNLFTHQIPRAYQECEPWIRSQFPQLMADSPGIPEQLSILDSRISEAGRDKGKISLVVDEWVSNLRIALGYPEMLPVYELAVDMHTRIDPISEMQAMVGDDRVSVIGVDQEEDANG